MAAIGFAVEVHDKFLEEELTLAPNYYHYPLPCNWILFVPTDSDISSEARRKRLLEGFREVLSLGSKKILVSLRNVRSMICSSELCGILHQMETEAYKQNGDIRYCGLADDLKYLICLRHFECSTYETVEQAIRAQ